MKKQTAGIHHITAIVGHPQENIDFYAGVLGLRLVKQTVNFDDPGTYHLYFGDGGGKPGTIITFFPNLNVFRIASEYIRDCKTFSCFRIQME